MRSFRFEITPHANGEGTLLVELVNVRAGVRGEISSEEIGVLIEYLAAMKKQMEKQKAEKENEHERVAI